MNNKDEVKRLLKSRFSLFDEMNAALKARAILKRFARKWIERSDFRRRKSTIELYLVNIIYLEN